MRRALLLCCLALAACATGPRELTPEKRAERAAWLAGVSRKLEASRYYPRDPRSPAIMPQGTVVLDLTLDRNGQPYTPKIRQSSGEPLLDAAALTTVLRAAPFAAPPPFLLDGGYVTLGVPLRYQHRPPGG